MQVHVEWVARNSQFLLRKLLISACLMQEQQVAGPAREAPQRRAARGGRLQAGLRRRQAAAAAAAAAAEEDSDEAGHDTDGEVTYEYSMVIPYLDRMLPAFMSLCHYKWADNQ